MYIFKAKKIDRHLNLCYIVVEVFETSKTIMVAIYNAIKYDNVYPVIMCGDTEAKKLISKAIQSVSHILPSTEKITVTQIH